MNVFSLNWKNFVFFNFVLPFLNISQLKLISSLAGLTNSSFRMSNGIVNSNSTSMSEAGC